MIVEYPLGFRLRADLLCREETVVEELKHDVAARRVAFASVLLKVKSLSGPLTCPSQS